MRGTFRPCYSTGARTSLRLTSFRLGPHYHMHNLMHLLGDNYSKAFTKASTCQAWTVHVPRLYSLNVSTSAYIMVHDSFWVSLNMSHSVHSCRSNAWPWKASSRAHRDCMTNLGPAYLPCWYPGCIHLLRSPPTGLIRPGLFVAAFQGRIQF